MTPEGGGAADRGGSPADRYERMYPGTGIPEAQKEERMQREDFKQERHETRRTTRNRGIVVPDLPWHKET